MATHETDWFRQSQVGSKKTNENVKWCHRHQQQQQLKEVHCWAKTFLLQRHNERQLFTCNCRLPATIALSSGHPVRLADSKSSGLRLPLENPPIPQLLSFLFFELCRLPIATSTYIFFELCRFFGYNYWLKYFVCTELRCPVGLILIAFHW